MSLKNRIIGLAAIGASALALAPVATAKTMSLASATATTTTTVDQPCGPTEAVFAPWGDNALYALVDGGAFEAGAPGWSLTGPASVVRDLDNGLNLAGARDEYALELGPQGVAVSPPICVTKDSTQFRFLSNALGAASKVPNLRVVVRYQGKDNRSFDLTSPDGRSAPSDPISLASGQFQDGTTISLKFRSLNGATVRVDDVYMDPRMH